MAFSCMMTEMIKKKPTKNRSIFIPELCSVGNLDLSTRLVNAKFFVGILGNYVVFIKTKS